MPAFDTLAPRIGYPLSEKELRKFTGKHSALYDFLRFSARRDFVYREYDFLEKALDTTNLFSVANGGGASAASFAINLQAGGAIRATTGTANDDTASASLIMPLNWYGDTNCGMQCRVRIATNITAHKFDIGFVDGVPASNTSVINDIDTPTAYGADFAVLSADTTQTLTTPAFLTDGSTSGQDILKTNAAAVPNWTNGTTPIVNEYFWVRVQLIGNNAYCWVNGSLIAAHNTDTDGHIEGGVAVAPWFYLAAKSATSKSMDVDLLQVWADRSLLNGF